MGLLGKYSLGLAALLLGGSVFLSRLMGLVRDKVISWQYGAASEADLYFTAFVVPDFLNYLLAGGYISITLIPLLSQCFANDATAAKEALALAAKAEIPTESPNDSAITLSAMQNNSAIAISAMQTDSAIAIRAVQKNLATVPSDAQNSSSSDPTALQNSSSSDPTTSQNISAKHSETSNDPDSSGWKLFSAIFTWLSLGILSLTSIAFYFAPELAKLIGPGFTASEQDRLSFFLRIILPAQVFFLPGAALSALLYMRKQFLVPALMPLIYNGCIILGGLAFPYLYPQAGMEGFCVGVVLGAFLGALVLPWWAVRAGGLHYKLNFSHPLLKKFMYLALPLMLGQSIVVLDEQLVRIFGSLVGEGWVSLLNYSRRIMLVPVGVVAQAAGLASFPFLAALAAKGDKEGFSNVLNQALGGSLLLILPLTLYMIIMAAPILGLIFQGGQFTASDTLNAAPLLQIMLLAIPCWVVQQVLGRAFYAQQNTLLPAILGSLSTLLALPLYPIFIKAYGGLGVAMLTSVAVLVYTLALSLTFIHKYGAQALHGLTLVSLKNVSICLPGLLFSWWLGYVSPWSFLTAPPSNSSHWLNYLLLLSLSGLVFALSYLALAKLCLPQVWHYLAKFRRR